MTGKKKQVIPWGSFVKDPTSWMIAECIPIGFEWKDPSKIKIGEIFCLLDHWRDHEDQGLEPLVWSPTSPLFMDIDQSLKNAQTIHLADALEPQDLDEEVFILPHSDKFDEEENDERVCEPSEHASTIWGISGDRAPIDVEPLAMQMSDQLESDLGESNISFESQIYFVLLICTMYHL